MAFNKCFEEIMDYSSWLSFVLRKLWTIVHVKNVNYSGWFFVKIISYMDT